MASSSANGESQKVLSGRHLGKALEKSNFAQTCSLLSQFLRDKRSLGDANFARVECKGQDLEASRTTFNLLTTMENPADYSKQNSGPAAMDFLPQLLGSGSPAAIDNPSSKVDLRKPANPEPATAQMTIFYGGKVVVFDDFPAEKAEEIMTMAINGVSTKTSNGNDLVSASSNGEKVNPKPIMETKPTTNSTQEPVQHPPQPNASDMPIARRASLHRFLEKRKDRATSRAPYQVNPADQPEFTSKSGESNSKKDKPAKSLDLNM